MFKNLTADSAAQLPEIQKKTNEKFSAAGVIIIDPQSVYIDENAEIGAGTVIFPGVYIEGLCRIGGNCKIGPDCWLDNVTIGNGVVFRYSVAENSQIGSNSTVGPFAYIRPDCTIGERVKVGDFVEVKNSSVGDGTKISHLTYVGDSDVGSGVNFGCGTVTVNYDGKRKYRTQIGNGAFIGCNTNLIAPVSIGERAYTAAGSTITTDVPPRTLSIARVRQVNKEDWEKK
jgi:bifunctional UDP-N-acetylglucosamine pyrophosphorylase/glucosamine-1-phosphate N-acetyltransferase